MSDDPYAAPDRNKKETRHSTEAADAAERELIQYVTQAIAA